MKIIISKLKVNEWKKFKKLRLEALKKEPSSFGMSYKEESKLSDDEWKDKLQKYNDEKSSVMFFAKDEENLVGMIGAYWVDIEKVRHIGNIFGVYVNYKYRRKGIGKLLMDEILKKLDKMPIIKKIKLGVVTQKTPALKLYEKYGFNTVGKYEKELKIGDEYYDEYLMEKLKY